MTSVRIFCVRSCDHVCLGVCRDAHTWLSPRRLTLVAVCTWELSCQLLVEVLTRLTDGAPVPPLPCAPLSDCVVCVGVVTIIMLLPRVSGMLALAAVLRLRACV